MGQRGASDGWDPLVDPPSLLQVTVESTTRRPGLRLVAAGARGRAALSLVGAIAVVCTWLAVDGGGAARHAPARVASAYATAWVPPLHLHGVGQLDTATEPYRFPLGCMGMTITPQELRGALRSRTGPCWRYGVFVTAVLRRVDGVWRLALDATSRSCPRVALPAAVRAQIVVCRR